MSLRIVSNESLSILLGVCVHRIPQEAKELLVLWLIQAIQLLPTDMALTLHMLFT